MYLNKIKKEIGDFLTASSVETLDEKSQQKNLEAERWDRKISSVDTTAIKKKFSVTERGPNIENYQTESAPSRTHSRPSLPELHLADISNVLKNEEAKTEIEMPSKGSKKTKDDTAKKFGWIQGVLFRCILNILGAILYLRLSWVVGEAGILLGSVIVLLGALVTGLTALSMSAICTNGEIKGGGVYFMISRSLGPEFGGSIGIIFTIANNIGAALHIVGFGETVRDLMREHGARIVDGDINDVRIIGWATAIILLAIVTIGVSFEVKAQFVLLIILSVSFVSFLIGTFLKPEVKEQARGATGYSTETFLANMRPLFRKENFFGVFGVYFPAATGIMAGANISGDLKNPQQAIPKGTLLAIAITTVVYLCGVVISGSTCIRDASGFVEDFLNDTISDCANNGTCKYGLLNYSQVMEMLSAWGPLITAGIFSATLSSALASLVSAPKILQAVGNDKLYPFLHFFAKGYGKANEPRRGYLLVFVICVAVIGIGSLDEIAFIISNFFLASYALVNYSCFDASFSESVGFRPSFKYYNKWASLLGAVICICVMFVISWKMALVTFAFIMVLYVYISRKKPDVNWGSSNQAYLYKNTLQKLLKMESIEEHVKTYRPQVLLLTGTPIQRPSLIDFVSNITKRNSLLILGDVLTIETTHTTLHNLKRLSKFMTTWLKKRKVKAFYQPVAAKTLTEGVKCLLQTAGIGKLMPNILFMGYKTNWQTCDIKQVSDYFQALHYGFEFHMGVGIFRAMSAFDLMQTNDFAVENATFEGDDDNSSDSRSSDGVSGVDEDGNEASLNDTNNLAANSKDVVELRVETLVPQKTSPRANSIARILATDDVCINRELSKMSTPHRTFHKKVKKATTDVWWLYDDGGLTLLIPYLLSLPKSYLEGARLRIFSVARSINELESEKASMAALLDKFRIDYNACYVIPEISAQPSDQITQEFYDLTKPFLKNDNDDTADKTAYITLNELNNQKEKTHRHLRTRELLLKYSKEATLIVLTLPVPRKSSVSACLYLAWLEMLSKDLCPMLFIRGNQQSVLTFYS